MTLLFNTVWERTVVMKKREDRINESGDGPFEVRLSSDNPTQGVVMFIISQTTYTICNNECMSTVGSLFSSSKISKIVDLLSTLNLLLKCCKCELFYRNSLTDEYVFRFIILLKVHNPYFKIVAPLFLEIWKRPFTTVVGIYVQTNSFTINMKGSLFCSMLFIRSFLYSAGTTEGTQRKENERAVIHYESSSRIAPLLRNSE